MSIVVEKCQICAGLEKFDLSNVILGNKYRINNFDICIYDAFNYLLALIFTETIKYLDHCIEIIIFLKDL